MTIRRLRNSYVIPTQLLAGNRGKYGQILGLAALRDCVVFLCFGCCGSGLASGTVRSAALSIRLHGGSRYLNG